MSPSEQADTGLFGLGVRTCSCGRPYSVEQSDRGLCCICERDDRLSQARADAEEHGALSVWHVLRGSDSAGDLARLAAHSAFRAVPGLRALLLALLLVPAAASADTLSALVVTAGAADLASTEWALSQPGTREANPLLQGPAQRIAFKTVATAAILGGSRQLERHGHKGWAKAIKILAVVGWGAAATNNAIQARRAR